MEKIKEHIVIDKDVKEELDKLGNKGDSYNEIIKRLLKKK